MAFVWVEDISKGIAEISKAATEEIRTNLDQIKDNEACVADKVSYNASQDTAVDSGYNSVHYNDEHSTYRSDHNSGVDTGENSVYNSGENGTYYNDVNQSEDAPHDSYVHDTYLSNVLNLDLDSYRGGYWQNDYADYRVGVYYSEDSAQYIDVYSPHKAEVYAPHYGSVRSTHHAQY